MSRLVKIGTAAVDLEEVTAVHGTQVYFRDGRTIVVSYKAAAAILEAIPEWGGSIRAVRPPAPPAPPSPPFPPATSGDGC